MRQTTLAVFAIVAIAAMMGAASVAPAYAAKKTVDIVVALDDTTGDQRDICGFGLVKLNWFKSETRTFTLWDNGHFKLSFTWEKEYYEKADTDKLNLIATASSTTKKQGSFEDPEDLSEVIILTEKSLVKCKNGEPSEVTHSGFTLHKDGTVTVHNE